MEFIARDFTEESPILVKRHVTFVDGYENSEEERREPIPESKRWAPKFCKQVHHLDPPSATRLQDFQDAGEEGTDITRVVTGRRLCNSPHSIFFTMEASCLKHREVHGHFRRLLCRIHAQDRFTRGAENLLDEAQAGGGRCRTQGMAIHEFIANPRCVLEHSVTDGGETFK